MLLQSGDRIVFTGDSTTDAGRARPVGEGLHQGVGDGYVRQIENILNVLYPDWVLWISNTGNSGDTSRGLKARWQNDVMNLNPDWVSVMIHGMMMFIATMTTKATMPRILVSFARAASRVLPSFCP